MRPLDPVEARLFPSLAKYARKVRRRGLLALIGIALSAYVLGRDVLSAYQGRVAASLMLACLPRQQALETQYQRDHVKSLTVSKAQANDSAWRREKEGRQ